jgi:hypothetical protein
MRPSIGIAGVFLTIAGACMLHIGLGLIVLGIWAIVHAAFMEE